MQHRSDLFDFLRLPEEVQANILLRQSDADVFKLVTVGREANNRQVTCKLLQQQVMHCIRG
jgi:hypothetical protein